MPRWPCHSAVRLAIIRQRYNPFGGAERFVERAVAALAGQEMKVTIIARQWEGGEGWEGVQGERTDDRQVMIVNPAHIGRRWRDASFARAVCIALEHAPERFDLVQSHERLACCDIYRAGDGVHRQWLAHRGRTLGTAARFAMLASPYHRYLLRAEQEMFESPRLRAVICNSRMVREDIRRYFDIADDKLHVIYNGVDLERFHPRVRTQHRAAMRERLGLRDDEMVYLFVGAGFERKGVPQLLQAFARLDPLNGPSSRLLVVGPDKAGRAMQAQSGRLGLGARVHFAGAQSDVLPWYGAADCFVLPTLYDPFPNAAVEALACGLPIITSFQSGAAELVRSAINGFICDALDVAGLSQAMQRAVQLRSVAAREASRGAVATLSLEAMGAKLAALYAELLPGK